MQSSVFADTIEIPSPERNDFMQPNEQSKPKKNTACPLGRLGAFLLVTLALLLITLLGAKNPRLHTDEVLIALSMCAVSDPNAKLALQQLPKLAGCQLHTSAILSAVDMNTFKKLGIEFTNEAVYEGRM